MKNYFLLAILALVSLSLTAKNREPHSPDKTYKFNLAQIQDTVRAGLLKADGVIAELEANDMLSGVAEFYFKDYLDGISSYNLNPAATVDMKESYKTDLVNAYVLKEFKERYPKLIHDRSKWMFNSVGGIYAHMLILYVSRTEYIVIWGTSIKAENKFSGYYPFMNEFDVMTRGEMHSNDLDAPGHAPVIYRASIQDGVLSTTVDTSNLIPKNVRAYYLAEHTYMVSYAQGTMWKAFFPGTIMPGVFVNQDWGGVASHVKESVLSYYLSKTKHKLKDWRSNANYRAIWVAEDYVKHQQKSRLSTSCTEQTSMSVLCK